MNAPLRARHLFSVKASPLVLLIAMGNLLLRPHDPLAEVLWTAFSYHFATIFLGPIVAGLAALDGVHLSRSREFICTGVRAPRLLFVIWGQIAASLLVSYVAGMAAVIGLAISNGATTPDARVIATLIPAAALLTLASAVGLSMGWVSGSWLSAPLATLGFFMILVLGYTVADSLVRVGGATASMVSIRPRSEVELAQTVLYLGAASLALTLASPYAKTRAWAWMGLSGTAVAMSILFLVPRIGSVLETVVPPTTCNEHVITICLTPEYERYRDELAESLDPLISALRRAGAPTPEMLTQDSSIARYGVGFIPQLRDIDSTAELREIVVVGSVFNAYTAGCPLEKREVSEPAALVLVWIQSVYRHSDPANEGVPSDVAESIEYLASCSNASE